MSSPGGGEEHAADAVTERSDPTSDNTEQREPDSSHRNVSKAQFNRWVGAGTGLVSLVLVGLFIQKSDGNSAIGTVLYLALGAAGALLILAAIVAIRFRSSASLPAYSWYLKRPVLYMPGAALGVVGLLLAFVGIDAEDSDFEAKPDSSEVVHDGGGFALRGAGVVANPSTFRLVVSAINTTKATQVANKLTFTFSSDGPLLCDSDVLSYRVTNLTKLSGGDAVNGDVSALNGPLQGFDQPLNGSIQVFCDTYTLAFTFPAPITLGPQRSEYLTLDLPRQLNLTLTSADNSATNKNYAIGSTETIDLPDEIHDPQYETIVSARIESGPSDTACSAVGYGKPTSHTDLDGVCTGRP